jgi:hypothetical protein
MTQERWKHQEHTSRFKETGLKYLTLVYVHEEKHLTKFLIAYVSVKAPKVYTNFVIYFVPLHVCLGPLSPQHGASSGCG